MLRYSCPPQLRECPSSMALGKGASPSTWSREQRPQGGVVLRPASLHPWGASRPRSGACGLGWVGWSWGRRWCRRDDVPSQGLSQSTGTGHPGACRAGKAGGGQTPTHWGPLSNGRVVSWRGGGTEGGTLQGAPALVRSRVAPSEGGGGVGRVGGLAVVRAPQLPDVSGFLRSPTSALSPSQHPSFTGPGGPGRSSGGGAPQGP